MSWQDVRSFYEEQDDPPESKPPRCRTCGAFLPWNPTGTTKRMVGADHVYDAEGNVIGLKNEQWEEFEVWDCKACGDKACGDFHEWEEVYGD